MMNLNKKYNAAIYIRLSKEDDNLGESESIQNQKILLTVYVKDQGFNLVDIYIDDGYTGTNFERPSFKRMLKDVENGKVNMVITKDLSRLSRDYIGTGEYVEKWFPRHGVRYIALTDSIDTEIDSANNDIAPFKAILNDMYAKDLSKKIRTALRTMQKEGKWVGGCPPYGYKVDPEDKNHLVVDEEEGEVVKRIFSLFYSGYKINQIRDILNKEKVPTFSVSRNRSFERSGNGGNIYGFWSSTTIKKMLKNRLYTGDMVQNRRSRVNYKYRKIVCNPKDEWIIKENTHEALVSKEVFDKVGELLPKQKQRNDKRDYFMLDGLLKCADCGHNIGVRARRSNGKATTVCNYYRKYKVEYNLCSNHGFDYDTIEDGIIDVLKKEFIKLDINEIKRIVKIKCSDNKTLDSVKNNIIKIESDISNLRDSLDNMYMDKLLNKITEDMYDRIYLKVIKDIELKEVILKEKKDYLNSIEEDKDVALDLKEYIKNFIHLKYVSRDLFLKLINYISIHDDGNIDVYFNFKEFSAT